MDTELPKQNEPETTEFINEPVVTEPVAAEPMATEPTSPLDTPSTGPTPTPPVAEPPKPSHRRRNIIIATILAIVVIFIAVGAAWAMTKPSDKKGQAVTTTTPVVPTDNAQLIVSKVITAITDKTAKSYQAPVVAQTSPTSTPPAMSPSYKVAGDNYYTTITKAYAISATDTTSAADTTVNQAFTQAVINQSTAVLTANGYKKTDLLMYGTEYQSANVICLVSLANSLPVSVACANKVDYAAASQAVKPFAAAYASNPSSQADNVFAAPMVKNSSVSGYQKATVSLTDHKGIGGNALLFYKHGSADWQFFMGTQSILNCSQYNTVDEQAAFADDKCIDSNNQVSTVSSSHTSTQGMKANPPMSPAQ